MLEKDNRRQILDSKNEILGWEKIRMVNFVTLFNCKNVHLIKDVGMIPRTLGKREGINSCIATYDNGNYSYVLGDEDGGVKLRFVNKVTGKFDIDACIWLWNNAKDIDILNVYHIRRYTFMEIKIYKMRNPLGKVYLKLDGGIEKEKYEKLNKKWTWRQCFKAISLCNLISTEMEALRQNVSQILQHEIVYVPDGFANISCDFDVRDKDNIIMTCGRLGTEQKNTQLLLESFRLICTKHSDWKLVLVGSIVPSFLEYINNFKNQFPQIFEKIVFTKEIEDREQLYLLYGKAKIFALTSRRESFGIVLAEAASQGCIIVSTDVGAAKEMIESVGCGELVDMQTPQDFAEGLENAICATHSAGNIYKNIREKAILNYSWETICDTIYERLM